MQTPTMETVSKNPNHIRKKIYSTNKNLAMARQTLRMLALNNIHKHQKGRNDEKNTDFFLLVGKQ